MQQLRSTEYDYSVRCPEYSSIKERLAVTAQTGAGQHWFPFSFGCDDVGWTGFHLDRLVLIDMATKHGRQGVEEPAPECFPINMKKNCSLRSIHGRVIVTPYSVQCVSQDGGHAVCSVSRVDDSSYDYQGKAPEVRVPARGKCEPLAASYRCLIKGNELKYGQPRNLAGDGSLENGVGWRKTTRNDGVLTVLLHTSNARTSCVHEPTTPVRLEIFDRKDVVSLARLV
ncbi:hypothetical protein MGYG_00880 [Nannizzia gypsea CBS 118893]|uniref:Uncharacterized protein n=1 Tax=Arthroderma gypseum (strain ATCC MYA-4604 / CBS 118893) TaxID=535722 RepID=E5R2G8_ARTGP|nr:hypothetical protein MGYG_00880 [Nannizzia gypsea CBS 118893]EFQ97844.1 hypothetical protein MGYG_00880 [Nannizzia gypsea CBS 118893]